MKLKSVKLTPVRLSPPPTKKKKIPPGLELGFQLRLELGAVFRGVIFQGTIFLVRTLTAMSQYYRMRPFIAFEKLIPN